MEVFIANAPKPDIAMLIGAIAVPREVIVLPKSFVVFPKLVSLVPAFSKVKDAPIFLLVSSNCFSNFFKSASVLLSSV